MTSEVRILALFGGMARLGSERGNLDALSALREGGATVKLMVSDAIWAEEIRQDIAGRGFEIRKCPYLLLPRPERKVNPLLQYPGAILRASAILWSEIRRYRPTHIYTSSQLFVLNFLPILMLTRIPLIYRSGDQPALHSPLFRGLWRFIRGRAHRFVAVSGFIADFVVATGVARDRITVIYTRPTSRRVEARDATRRADVFRFVFVGQISETKGVRVLIEAFRGLVEAHPDARLVVAGRISDWEGDAWARELRDDVNADPVLGERVSFIGFVEDVPTLLASCDVAVTPTITVEALANVVMEAKQAGLPSIIFRCGGLPEVIEHGADGYISEARTVEGLREALRFYLENRDQAARQGEAARKSLGKFGVDRFVEQWTDIVTHAGDRVGA